MQARPEVPPLQSVNRSGSRRPVGALLIGLLIGLLLFGPAGFLVGATTADGSGDGNGPGTPSSAGSSAPPTLSPFEANQLTLNRAKVTGDLTPLAESWLPWIGGCLSNADARGPKVEAGEQTRVFCELSHLNVYFIRYNTTEDRDKARLFRQRQNVDAAGFAPGVAPATQKPGTSARTDGSYIEFAYRVGAGADARTIVGVWWDDSDSPVGAYVETLWTDGVGENWEPLRDVWQRYS